VVVGAEVLVVDAKVVAVVLGTEVVEVPATSAPTPQAASITAKPKRAIR
jgi:hypothetical protein